MAASVSVVLPAGGSPWLAEQLAALARQRTTVEWELVLAQNVDLGDVALPAGLPPTRRVDARERRSASWARNAGIAAAEGDVVLICDDDDVVDTGWVQAMSDAFEATGADLVAGRLEEELLNGEPARHWRPTGMNDGMPVPHRFLPSGWGANIGARAEALRRLDGFTWDGSGDDIDLFWRAQLAGLRVAFAPDAVIHYRYKPELRSHVRQHRTYGKGTTRLLREYGGHGLRNPALDAVVSVARIVPRPSRYRGRRVTLGGILGQVAHTVGAFQALPERKGAPREGLGLSRLPPAG